MSEPAKRFTIPGRGDVSEWDYQQWRRQCVDVTSAPTSLPGS